jgi:DHA1 family multidrug resistance protein-like MFS transporter
MRMFGTRENDRASFIAVLIAEFIALMGFAASTPIIPSFLRELRIESDDDLKLWSGLATALPSLMVAVFSPIWGSLADSRGRKPMLLRALFGSSIVIALMSLSTAPWQLLALRTVQGCVTGTVAAATVLVAAMSPEAELGRRLGLLQAAVFMGNSLGPFFGGKIAEVFGNRVSFIFTSGLLLLGGLVIVIFVKEGFTTPSTVPEVRNKEKVFQLKRWAPLIPLFGVIFAYQLSGSNVAPILPLFVEKLMPGSSSSRSLSGIIIGAVSVTSALSAATSGRIADRIGHWRVLIITLGSAAVLVVLQSFVRTPLELLILRASGGLFLGGTMPSVNALIASRSPHGAKGKAFGLSTTVGQTGAALGPLMGAGISILLGYRAVFAATGVLLGIIALAIGFDARRGFGGQSKRIIHGNTCD